MKKILKIVSSVKGSESFSNKLSDAVVDKLLTQYPGSEVHTLDLTKEMLPHLETQHVAAFFTPEAARTPVHKEDVKNSDRTIQLLMDADFVVIGTPMYNFSIPSTLKSWIDHISRAGITFSYADGTPKGLVSNKKVYLAIASGGVYSEGPMKAFDFIEPYMRFTLGFYGMTDVTIFRIEGTNVPQLKDAAISKGLESVNAFAF